MNIIETLQILLRYYRSHRLTDLVDSLKKKIRIISTNGAEDAPEDWVGAYKKLTMKYLEEIGIKLLFIFQMKEIIKKFTKDDKCPNE